MYEKILVPVDGSEHSKRALNEAIKVAKMTGGTITLLHVQPKRAPLIPPAKPQDKEASQSAAQSILVDGKRIVEAEGVSVQTLLLEGNVVDQIVKTAKEGQFGLVVVGARGLSKLEEIMMGSVSHGVAENAPCPVIVTR
ncbi:MAG: universal stress protein [Candidatus Bathyarchaeota archaeon]|nr:universal stress protein [Candidatus Bathyarchaeota archaeon]